MKHIKFNEDQVDSFLFMELSDVGQTLGRNSEIEVEYGYKSYFDINKNKIVVSRFWDDYSEFEKRYGLFSDVYLRSLGGTKYTNFRAIEKFNKEVANTSIVSFLKQLFALLEDLRVEDLIIKERPGTKKAFQLRRDVHRRFFKGQLNVNTVQSIFTDALYNAIYLLLTAGSPLFELQSIHSNIDLVIPFVQSETSKVYDAKSTSDIVKIVWSVYEVLDEVLEKDMLNLYFLLPEPSNLENLEQLTIDDLKRKDPLKNKDIAEKKSKGDEETHEEKLPTWHQETEEPTKSFLQFELEQGTQTDLLGEGVREGEDGDQALGVVQGASKNTAKKDYSKLETLDTKREEEKKGQYNEQYGKENKHAIPLFIQPNKPTPIELQQYHKQKVQIISYQKKLKQMIQKTLEHKKILPRTDLHIGRLNKKLVRFLTEENPRLFYKKDQTSPEIDAVFSLLVDCSASMYDKMDQTKLGIILFHEALKSVSVPHNIVGFWEDTGEASALKQPNYFQPVVDFTNYRDNNIGAAIMQLQPEEDNRDGFAIRVVAKKLLLRQEKQKFLLVFSDGEPAAFDYDQKGIVDTHEAVVDCRKHGIEVINVFLANGEISESQQKTIHNIYGKYSILVPRIEDLPDVLFPLLKRLLLKSI